MDLDRLLQQMITGVTFLQPHLYKVMAEHLQAQLSLLYRFLLHLQGNYTAIVSGASGATGVSLVEVYDEETGGASIELSNLSTRAYAGTGDYSNDCRVYSWR